MRHPITRQSTQARTTKEDVMNCHRCHGLMVRDRAYDLLDTHIHCDVWRCICCGNMFDTLMLLNKRRGQAHLQLEHADLSIEQLTAA